MQHHDRGEDAKVGPCLPRHLGRGAQPQRELPADQLTDQGGQRAEAQRIQIETQAAAEAEKTRLQGEGQANYRREIANGIVDQIKSLQAVGMNINDVNNVVLFNQYLDVMRSLSESNNTKTVVLPASTPGGYQDLYEQVTKAMLTASETK